MSSTLGREQRFGGGALARWSLAGLALALAAIAAARVARSARPAAPVARCAAGSAAAPSPPGSPSPPLAPSVARIALGRRIFFDRALSEPGGTSCASCHDPAHGYAGNNGSHSGTARGSRPGHFARRATPSLMYLGFVHRFHWHWEEDAALPDGAGGFFWDGRADSLAALVEQPLTNPDEMNVRDRAQIADKLRTRPYAADLRAQFGAATLDSPDAAMGALGQALEAFLLSDELSPFRSRYDDFIRGRATLTAREQQGLALFRDPAKGNCAFCHKLDPSSPNPRRSPFTDYGFETVGVPRNPRLPGARHGDRFDLGLCETGSLRAHTGEERFCGSFRTPSLRNVALRPSFMHNGYFTRLRDVVAFYATRNVTPRRWYGGGKLYDDLPARYHEYVNEAIAPYDRGAGERPRLDDDEIDALVAFLETLTDAVPASVPLPPL
jgi:cytochrome c peroxidase